MKRHIKLCVLCIAVLTACQPKFPHVQGYIEGENLYIASSNAGNLIHLMVRRGQFVKKGDLIFQLDPDPQKISVLEAQDNYFQAQRTLQDLILPRRKPEIAAIEAQIAQAQAQIKLADLRVTRNQTLYAKHVMDKDTLDASVEHQAEVVQLKAQYTANLDLAQQGARSEQIRAQSFMMQAQKEKLRQARWELAQKTQRAPDDGLIFDTYFKDGEYVPAQKPVASLLSPKQVRIDFFVSTFQLSLLKIGQKIGYTPDGSDQMRYATINYISPQAEYVPPLIYSRENQDNLVFRIKANLKHAFDVKPGQPVVVWILPANSSQHQSIWQRFRSWFTVGMKHEH